MTPRETLLTHASGFTHTEIQACYAYLAALPRNSNNELTGGYNWLHLRHLSNMNELNVFGCLTALGWISARVIPNTYGHTAYSFHR